MIRLHFCTFSDFGLNQHLALFQYLEQLLVPVKNHVVLDFSAKAGKVLRVLTIADDMAEKLQELLTKVSQSAA